MNIDLQTLPSHIDIIHLGLTAVALVFFVLFLINRKTSNNAITNQLDTSDNKQVETKTNSNPPEKKPQEPLKQASPDAALQLLSLLQQDARFIDFIQEDLSGYDDSDIGAAARIVHEGSKKTLNNYFDFTPIRAEDEETKITLEAGFNASEVRLTGSVVGEAPFSGTLIHKGWKVNSCKLPKTSKNHDTSIIAPAEIEL